jgi:hypothetical protein
MLWLVYIIPFAALFIYLTSVESLSKSVGILLGCIFLTGGIILFAVYGSSEKVKAEELESVSIIY